AFDTGEDIDGTGTLYTYGANAAYATHIHAPGVTPLSSLTGGQLGILSGLSGTALTTNKNCTSVPAYASAIWPMVVATNPDSLRENPPLFFRRAVKLVNGNDLTT